MVINKKEFKNLKMEKIFFFFLMPTVRAADKWNECKQVVSAKAVIRGLNLCTHTYYTRIWTNWKRKRHEWGLYGHYCVYALKLLYTKTFNPLACEGGSTLAHRQLQLFFKGLPWSLANNSKTSWLTPYRRPSIHFMIHITRTI